ncbi:MAG: hypothetical protein NZ455_13975 [Bacteroidia bacterium]|nr:hypothetical protein [Bacteroidia bacterium]MDW8346734.1 hypothetical protein [Bacteroidia bacterium]
MECKQIFFWRVFAPVSLHSCPQGHTQKTYLIENNNHRETKNT